MANHLIIRAQLIGLIKWARLWCNLGDTNHGFTSAREGSEAGCV